MWLCTSALYSRLPCLGCVNWFVSYKPLICTTRQYHDIALTTGQYHNISLATVQIPQYIHTGSALIYVIGRIQARIIGRNFGPLEVQYVTGS